MKTDLKLSHLTVAPGHSGRVSVDVTNTADVIDGVTAIVDGINPDWIRLDQPVVSLFPDATDQLDLVIDIPPSCPAGDYLVVVRIVSTVDVERQTVHDFWLTVEARPNLSIDLRPSIVTGGAEATLAATIVNTGNSPIEVTVDALEPTREIDCLANPAAITIPQGAEALVDIEMRGPRPWFGEPRVRTVTITARAEAVESEALGTFRQKARVPRGLITALILAMIIVLWALIFWFVISGLQRRDPPAKAIGTDFTTGLANIPLLAIAATAEGTVTASTTGQGVPRITVDAFRIAADGSAQPAGSAATDDDGLYSLKSLIPGNYKLRFTSAGFDTLWYPDAADQAAAEVVPFDPTQIRNDLDVVMTGQSGQLLGQIEPPPGAPNTPLQVTATLLDGATEPPFTATTVTTDGTIDLTGLPTPGTYQVTVTGDGFQTQQFEQRLDGGQASVLNTVNVVAATGSISGTVLDGNGAPVGGAFVTARSGDIEVRTVTPTTGAVGQFTLVGLVTPQTYVLTFAQPGATSTTAALSLNAGESRSGVVGRLIGGSGTIVGSAVAADGTPLGGISVRVLGDDFESTTSTLTTSGPAGAAGSFSISGLPVPGNYTLSLSGPGLQTETVGATFLGAGQQALGAVALLPNTAQVRGVVSGPQGPLGSVRVTLSDGTERSRVTTSATNPAGTWAFAGTPPGSYTLTFEQAGFQRRVVLVAVRAGQVIQQNVTLTPAAAP